MAKEINVRCMATPQKDIFSFVLSSSDGTALDHRDILDALCEYMLVIEEEAKLKEWSSGPV